MSPTCSGAFFSRIDCKRTSHEALGHPITTTVPFAVTLPCQLHNRNVSLGSVLCSMAFIGRVLQGWRFLFIHIACTFIHPQPSTHLSASDASIIHSICGSKVEAGPRFYLSIRLPLSLLSSNTPRKNCLTLSTMPSISTSFYGIHSHDDHDPHQNFMAPIDASFNTSSGEPLCPTPFDGVPAPSVPNPNNISATRPSREELPAFLMNGAPDDVNMAPAFPKYNAAPHFRSPFPFMISSQLISGSPKSPERTLAPSPGPSRGGLPKRSRKSEGTYAKRIAAYLAKSKRLAPARGPTRNTNRRPSGAGYGDMFVRSSRPILNNYKRLLTERNPHVPS